MTDVMNITCYKQSWNLHCTDTGVAVTIVDVLKHIQEGGTIRATGYFHEEANELIMKRLLKHINLDTDQMYEAIRAGKKQLS